MALSVTIDNGSTTYALPTEEAEIIYARKPMQAPLPGGDPILIDLGQIVPSIILSGRVDDTAGSSGGNTIPTKNNLEDALESWYTDTVTVTIGGDAYVSKFNTARFKRKGGVGDQIWDFILTFVSVTRT
jgi:hypothetical protein